MLRRLQTEKRCLHTETTGVGTTEGHLRFVLGQSWYCLIPSKDIMLRLNVMKSNSDQVASVII